jgi:hypothetical protein
MNGIKMSNRNAKAVRSWETLISLKDVQPFLGFANFYHEFIKNFSGVA